MTSTALLENPDLINAGTKEKVKGSFWGAAFMVSGTCIGGGMLALPVQTAESGFWLSALAIFACWAFMTYTGLLLVEATMWVKNGTHFASLPRILIGNKTKVIALVIYFFMNYASLVAYTSGGASLIKLWGETFFGHSISYETGCTLYTIIFGGIVLLGAHFIGRLNFWLMIGLVVAYMGLVAFGLNKIDTDYLVFRPSFSQGVGIMSLILATFSYQMVVPAVCSYLDYDVSMLKRAVITGTTLSMSVYLLWMVVVHGIVPLEGENGLAEAFSVGASATIPLRYYLDHASLTLLADLFAFLAITTSYIGLSMALFYFLKDCFNEIKIEVSRSLIVILTVLPTLYLAICYERALLQSLELSGGFGDTILSGLIPIGMVWMGRYRKNLDGSDRIPGGKPALVAASLFFLFFLGVQCYQLI